jgi:hypothetical protein
MSAAVTAIFLMTFLPGQALIDSAITGSVVDSRDQPVAGAEVWLSARMAALLPVVEQIDPALVSEVFWRVIALRPPIGDPRRVMDYPSLRIAVSLACYERVVASVLFQPGLTEIERLDARGVRSSSQLETWSLIDPRAAVAWMKRLPANNGTDANSNWSFTQVVQLLSLQSERRWRSIWRSQSGLGDVLFDRDLW